MKMAFLFLMVLLALQTLPASEIPDNYKGLQLGSDSAKLHVQYPSTEKQLFSLHRHSESPGKGVTVYSLVNKKGNVDSVRFYFVDNKLAMAMEYYYPGRKYMEEAVKGITARFGQLVGRGMTYWRTWDNIVIRVSSLQQSEIATVAYLDMCLTTRMDERTGAGHSEEMKALDRELKSLNEELKNLEKSKQTPRK